MSSDPDRPLHIKIIVSITSVFVVLAGLVAVLLESRRGIGPAGIMGILIAGLVAGLIASATVVKATGSIAGGVVQVLTGAGNISPAPSFSYQEALVMQGKPDAAVESFRDHLLQHPADQEARLALATLLAGAANNSAEAEREFLAVRTGRMTNAQEFRASQALIDLYAATEQRGKYMAELARFAERYRGTPAGDGAKRALAELKKA